MKLVMWCPTLAYCFIYIAVPCLSHMIPEFKHVLNDIADEITVNQLSTLAFMYNVNLTSNQGEKLTALDILWKLIQKGTFAYDNTEPLKKLLGNIERYDLMARFVEPYQEKYGEQTKSSCKCEVETLSN